MSVTTVMLRVLADAVAQYGISVDELTRGTAVAPETFARNEGVIRESEYEQLVSRAVALTGDDAFGLHWAERSSFAAFDLMGHVVAAVPTYGDALKVLVDLFPLISDGNEFDLRVDDQVATLMFHLTRSPPPSAFVKEEFIVASCVRLLQLFAGSAGMPLSAHFTYAAPPHRSEYTRYFEGAERFEQPFTGMAVARKLLHAKRLCHDPDLERDLRVRARARLERTTFPVPYAKRVKDCLLENPYLAGNQMKGVAERLGLSERSLRRHLAKEGVNFPALRVQALCARARQLLTGSEVPIKEIARSLGFSDTTAFHRAFKTWTGTTPAAFRAAGRTSDRAAP